VKFHQEDTLMRILLNIIEQGIRIRYARVDCGSYSKAVVRLLLQHSQRIFVRAEMTKTLRGKLQNPRRQWRKVEVNNQSIEVLSLPFDGFGGEIGGCRLVVQRQHKGAGAQLDLFEEGGDDVYVYRAILTNEWDMTEEEVIHFYNQRGAKEKVFDQMDNDFGGTTCPSRCSGRTPCSCCSRPCCAISSACCSETTRSVLSASGARRG
jgi:Transposase DDE domain.